MSSSYHMKYKETFIEASFTNNIHTGEKSFYSYYYLRLVSCFFSDKVKKTCVTRRVVYFGLFEFSLHF